MELWQTDNDSDKNRHGDSEKAEEEDREKKEKDGGGDDDDDSDDDYYNDDGNDRFFWHTNRTGIILYGGFFVNLMHPSICKSMQVPDNALKATKKRSFLISNRDCTHAHTHTHTRASAHTHTHTHTLFKINRSMIGTYS